MLNLSSRSISACMEMELGVGCDQHCINKRGGLKTQLRNEMELKASFYTMLPSQMQCFHNYASVRHDEGGTSTGPYQSFNLMLGYGFQCSVGL